MNQIFHTTPLDDRQSIYEQHMLERYDDYRKLLTTVDLTNVTVVEIGVGSGNLTRLILERNPKRIMGYEIDPTLITLNDPRLTMYIGDARTADLKIFSEPNTAFIANPPYQLLPFLRAHAGFNQLKKIIMMVSEKKLALWPEFEPCFKLSAADFSPPGENNSIHWVIKKWLE